MTSLMTSRGPDQKSVWNTNFPKVGDHRVKISAQSHKNCRRSILKTGTDILTSWQTDKKVKIMVAKAERLRTNKISMTFISLPPYHGITFSTTLYIYIYVRLDICQHHAAHNSCKGCRGCHRPQTCTFLTEQIRKVLWIRKGVRATVVTAGHCKHAELTSGHALAGCYSCCVHSRVYAN